MLLAGRADAKRLLVALVASALVLAYVFFSSVEFKGATLIYFSMFTITLLVIFNQAFFKRYWYVGIALYAIDWFLINNPGVQAAYLAPASIVLLASYLFIIPQASKVVSS